MSQERKEDVSTPKALVVLDMDGTLYKLDGTAGGYSDSSLSKIVYANAVSFLIDKGNFEPHRASEMVSQILARGKSLSVALSEICSCTRNDYFNQVWNIDPLGLIDVDPEIGPSIEKLRSFGAKIVLVTQAPSVWKSSVLKHLGIEESWFEAILTVEQFDSKTEVMARLLSGDHSHRYSIGDQVHTDIQPAIELGYEGRLVNGPKDTVKCLQEIISIYEAETNN